MKNVKNAAKRYFEMDSHQREYISSSDVNVGNEHGRQFLVLSSSFSYLLMTILMRIISYASSRMWSKWPQLHTSRFFRPFFLSKKYPYTNMQIEKKNFEKHTHTQRSQNETKSVEHIQWYLATICCVLSSVLDWRRQR